MTIHVSLVQNSASLQLSLRRLQSFGIGIVEREENSRNVDLIVA
jgi:hypothetical protein